MSRVYLMIVVTLFVGFCAGEAKAQQAKKVALATAPLDDGSLDTVPADLEVLEEFLEELRSLVKFSKDDIKLSREIRMLTLNLEARVTKFVTRKDKQTIERIMQRIEDNLEKDVYPPENREEVFQKLDFVYALYARVKNFSVIRLKPTPPKGPSGR